MAKQEVTHGKAFAVIGVSAVIYGLLGGILQLSLPIFLNYLFGSILLMSIVYGLLVWWKKPTNNLVKIMIGAVLAPVLNNIIISIYRLDIGMFLSVYPRAIIDSVLLFVITSITYWILVKKTGGRRRK